MFEELISELEYRFSRSSGPGGQSVNKVSTQVELLFDIERSMILTDNQKHLIFQKLKNRINSHGILLLKSNETRSQLKNKEIVASRFITLVSEALKPVKKRKATKPTKASVRRRLDEKKKVSTKKKDRKIIDED